jgi:uncharacterized protein
VSYWVLLYDVVPDYVERRGEFRAEHLGLATAAHERGELVMAGALAEPADAAILVFTGDDPSAAAGSARAPAITSSPRSWAAVARPRCSARNSPRRST